MGVPQTRSEDRRIRAIDAARGSAMFFVFFSHFVEVYFKCHGISVNLAYAITQIASPAFISISGLMLGILAVTRHQNYPATRSSFVRRGVFLLTVGRLLIYLAHVPMAGGWHEALHWGFMTDAIGVCIIVGPLLVGKVSAWGRAILGFAVYIVSWVMVFFWVPSMALLIFLKETLFGALGSDLKFYADVFPILPWVGLYLIATAVGEHWGEKMALQQTRDIGTMARRIGISALVIAGTVVAVRILVDALAPGSIDLALRAVLSPQQKLPPGPVYFLFYCGLMFLGLYILHRYQTVGLVDRASSFAEILGRNSLFAFIAQYAVYFGLFPVMSFSNPSIWPVLFLISAVGLWWLSYFWDRAKLNRYLTVPKLRVD
jgi:uncharacterized membrane protein